MPEPATPTGRELRQRLAALDRDTRQHILHQVRNGHSLREREWALLAVSVARIRRRELLLVCLIAPGLVFGALLTGTVAGRWSWGYDPWAAAWMVITWYDGLPWIALWVGLTGLLLLITRSHRARLRRAEVLNRERLHT